MNRKRIGKLVIVLFLLAALPVMTAVMAQEQGTPAKATALAPAVEMGETITPFPWRSDEIANMSNDTRNSPGVVNLRLGQVYGGAISQAGDIDYWKIPGDWHRHDDYSVLINIDAQSFDSPLDSKICLYSDDNVEMGCNDDAGGVTSLDSLLYFQLERSRDHYLMVKSLYTTQGGANYRYQLQVTQPLLVSAAATKLPTTANVMGIPIQSGDILAWSEVTQTGSPELTYEKWVMLLDLSDLVAKGSLVNLTAGWRNSDYLLVSFGAKMTLPGIAGPVTPWEVVKFDPTQLGPTTQGTFQRWWNGKNLGLTTTAEKPDAIDWPQWNGTTRLSVSTVGAAAVPGAAGVLKLADEDLGRWDMSTGTWSTEFNGQGWWETPSLFEFNVNFGLGAKDVIGYTYSDGWDRDPSDPEYDSYWDDYFVVLMGTGTVKGQVKDWILGYIDHTFSVAYTQKDILRLECQRTAWGWLYWTEYCNGIVWWHGPDHGWNYNLDAIDVPEELD